MNNQLTLKQLTKWLAHYHYDSQWYKGHYIQIKDTNQNNKVVATIDNNLNGQLTLETSLPIDIINKLIEYIQVPLEFRRPKQAILSLPAHDVNDLLSLDINKLHNQTHVSKSQMHTLRHLQRIINNNETEWNEI